MYELRISYHLMFNAVQPSEGGTGCVDDAGYLNKVDGDVAFALDEGIDIDSHPNGDDDIDYRAGRAAIDACPDRWLKIIKRPINFDGGDQDWAERFLAENGIKPKWID